MGQQICQFLVANQWLVPVYVAGLIIMDFVVVRVLWFRKKEQVLILRQWIDFILILMSFIGMIYLPVHFFLRKKFNWYLNLTYKLYMESE